MKCRFSFVNPICLAIVIAMGDAGHAQTYQVGPNGTQVQPQADHPQAVTPSLGWGSNIESARIARAAQMALRSGDQAHALDLAKRAVESAPNDPQLWFLLGYAARLNRSYQQSVDAYSRGLRLSPSSLDGLSGLAQTYVVMRKDQEAERLLKQVLSADPKRINDAMVLGDLYLRAGDYAAAIDGLSRVERAHPDARSELLLAMCYVHLKQFDQADRYFKVAKKRSPGNLDLQRSLAGFFREIGRYPEAISALQTIPNPKPDVTAELAYTYQLAGKQADSARTYAQAANALPKDITLQLSAAQANVAAGSIEKANTFLQRVATIDPNYYRLHAIRGEVAKAGDKIGEAIQEYQSAVAHLPAEPVEGPLYGIELHMELVDLYRATRNEQAAHRQLETAQDEIDHVSSISNAGSDRAAFLRLRAQIRMNAGDLENALNDAKGALAIDPRDMSARQLTGDVLVKLGRIDEAVAAYKEILSADPGNRYALISLGYASRAAGRDQAAEKYFQRLAQLYPSSYVPYLALGDLDTSRRRFAEAQASYEKAFELAPQNALVVAGGINAAIEAHELNLAGKWIGRSKPEMAEEPIFLREEERYLSFKGDYKRSAEIARQAIKALPNDRDVVVYLGYDLLHMGRYEELLPLMQQYMDVLPEEPDIPLLMGYVHKHQGQSEEAKEDFTETLKRDASVTTAYVNRGYMLNDLNQPEAAASDFETALKRDTNDGEAHLGLAYTDLELNKPRAAIRNADLAEKAMGDSENVHIIRATAYGRVGQLMKSADEYQAALKFAPDDSTLHLSLATILFSERRYHDTIRELRAAENPSRGNGEIYALMARSYANLGDRDETLRYVQLAEQGVPAARSTTHVDDMARSAILISTGKALSTVGEKGAAMARFRSALEIPYSNRVSVRLAIAQTMAEQDRGDDAEREVALALMEAESGAAKQPGGDQYLLAADVFRSTHDYQLSQTYMQRAKLAGAPDADVRIGLANNYLALGETTKANAELAAVRAETDGTPNYQYLLAQANVYRQQHHGTQALTSFAEASNAESDDTTAATAMLQAGADEGLRVTPEVSILSDFTISPVFEDTTVYVLDAKLDAPFPVSSSDTSLLPPPRSSIQTQATTAFHLHVGNIPTPSGFFQVRNARGTISVPATNSIVDRNTTDYTLNFGLNPTVHLGDGVITFNGGVQTTIRRDSESPAEMNQNLFRLYAYGTTSSFFNAISASGYLIRESGPFTESDLHSRTLTGAIDFRVGSPWGKNALLTGWGATDQLFTPTNFENYYTSTYIGFERRFSDRLMARGLVEFLRAWRVAGPNTGIAQNLRPAADVDFSPKRNWDVQAAFAYSSNRAFHVYDALQSSFSVSYAMPFRRGFHDDSRSVVLQYPIRFAAGLQHEAFFNFTGGQSTQLRPFIQISLF